MEISKAVNFPVRTFPIEYLGIPLGGIPGKREFWIPVMECQRTLAIWKAKYLSFGECVNFI